MKFRFLMCPPDYFGVEYSINPWMTGNLGNIDPERAKKQWQSLFGSLSNFAEIERRVRKAAEKAKKKKEA